MFCGQHSGLWTSGGGAGEQEEGDFRRKEVRAAREQAQPGRQRDQRAILGRELLGLAS